MVGELLRSGGDVMIREGALRELKDHFDTGGNVIGKKSAAEQLLQVTEKVTNLWKGAVTIGNPETHLSNAARNKIASYIATCPLKGSDRAIVNRAMSGIGMNIESQVAEISGIMNAGFMTELGSTGRPSLAEMLLDEPAQQGAGKLLSNTKKAVSAAADMASQRYQGAEIKAKAGIVGSQLRQNGYTFRNNALVTPDGRVITDMKQLTPEDVQTIRDAGELADGFLFDYADQSRAVKLLRRTIDPFLTFWVNLLPLVSKLSVGMGPGTNGRPNLKMLTRFYTVPAILYSAGKLSQLLSDIDENEMKKLRDTRDDAYLRRDVPIIGDILSDTTHPLLPVRYNSQTGKYSWGWDKSDPNAHPLALNLMNVLPYSQINKPIGALSLPQALFPSGPWIDTMITAATGKRTFGNQQVIDPYSENPRMDLLKYSALNMLPQVKAADRLLKAAKGEPSRMGERPDSIATALFKSLNPVKVDVVDPELSDAWKRAAFNAEEAGFRKAIHKKYAPLLQLNAGNPEKIRQIQADMEREHLRRQAKLLLDSYPSQGRDRNTQWGQMKSSIDERLKAMK